MDSLLDFGVRRTRNVLGIRPGSSGDLDTFVHPDLKPAARAIEASAADFGEAVEAVLLTHGKGIINNQLVLKRIAESAMNIFAMAAVTSRATRALEGKSETAQHELLLASGTREEGEGRGREWEWGWKWGFWGGVSWF